MTAEVYHTSETAPALPSGNPYAYEVIPPIGRLLTIICANLRVGGCFRPGNRQLAIWAKYQSAGHIPNLLDQLACDGWITYDRESRLITLLRDPAEGSVIPSMDQRSLDGIDSEETDLIPSRDRDFGQQDAETESIPSRDQLAQRMEDSCLAAADHDSESAAARYKIPCAAEMIPSQDHPIALLLAELDKTPGRGVLEKVLVRDWTPQEIRDRHEYDEARKRIDPAKTDGIFWTALMAGERAPARPDPNRPLDPYGYADKDGFVLGSNLSPPESLRDRALKLLPPPTAETHSSHTRDWMYLQSRLSQGDSDEQALAALAAHRKAVGR